MTARSGTAHDRRTYDDIFDTTLWGSIAGLRGGGNCFVGREVACPPQVPACDRAPWVPAFGAGLHDGGLGQQGRSNFGRGFEALEGKRESFADSIVAGGQDVGTAKPEDEHHLDGPSPDAADLGEVFDDGFVGHAADASESRDGAVDGLCGEVAQGERLVVRKAGGTELLVRAVDEVLGRGV